MRRLRDAAEIATGRGRRRKGQGPLDGVDDVSQVNYAVVKVLVSKMELLRNLCSHIYQKRDHGRTEAKSTNRAKGSQLRN